MPYNDDRMQARDSGPSSATRHGMRVSNGAPRPSSLPLPPLPVRGPPWCCSRRHSWARWIVAEWCGRAVAGSVGAALSAVPHVPGAARLRLRQRQRLGRVRGPLVRLGRARAARAARRPRAARCPRAARLAAAASAPPTSTRTAAPRHTLRPSLLLPRPAGKSQAKHRRRRRSTDCVRLHALVGERALQPVRRCAKLNSELKSESFRSLFRKGWSS